MTTTEQNAYANRVRAASGHRDNDYWNAVCNTCPWVSLADYPNRTTEGRRLAERDAAEHNSEYHAPRFVVNAMHTQNPNDRSAVVVDYWRVEDTLTGMRANGTGKYETPEQARKWADALNAVRR
jgi:hypothetical protein